MKREKEKCYLQEWSREEQQWKQLEEQETCEENLVYVLGKKKKKIDEEGFQKKHWQQVVGFF